MKKWIVVVAILSIAGLNARAILPAGSQVATRSIPIAPFYGLTANGTQSVLRIANTGAHDGTVTVRLNALESGQQLAIWTTNVAAHTARDVDTDTLAAAASPALNAANARYQFMISSDFPGTAQNLLWNVNAGSWINLSACGAATAASGRELTRLLTAARAGQSQTIMIQNALGRTQSANFAIYDASSGARLGAYRLSVSANSSAILAPSSIMNAIGVNSESTINLSLASDFVGYAQALSTDTSSGEAVDMSAACALPVAETDGLTTPTQPAHAYFYADADVSLPTHYTDRNADLGNVARTDNTPPDNPISNPGAALGRTLFYDQRLSGNNTTSCASCHKQEFGFGDPNRKSFGFQGGLTARHSMSLANARYYSRGRFFWDERASTLETQVLMPIQDGTEMGMTLSALATKLAATDYYPALFQAAFGTPEITSDRISKALAQFVRALISTNSKLDRAFDANGNLNLAALTPQEQMGLRLFGGIGPGGPQGPGNPGRTVGCNRCHTTSAMVSDNVHNNGLDANTAADQGAGNGRFKAPSLRNIVVTAPYMHDGRFDTLAQVIEFYNSGVQDHPNLDNRLENNNGQPVRLNLSQAEKDALAAFMNTLTDTTFLTDPRFSNPF